MGEPVFRDKITHNTCFEKFSFKTTLKNHSITKRAVYPWTLSRKLIPPKSVNQTWQVSKKSDTVLNHTTQKRGQMAKVASSESILLPQILVYSFYFVYKFKMETLSLNIFIEFSVASKSLMSLQKWQCFSSGHNHFT